MKRILMATFLVMAVFSSTAFALGTVLSQYSVTGNMAIKNVTCTVANTYYPMTFDAGSVVEWNIHAKGGGVKFYPATAPNTTNFTIDQGATFWDHCPVPLPINTTFFVQSPTAGATAEVFYSYN